MNTKTHIIIEGLPQIEFAHIFGAESYRAHFSAAESELLHIEIAYITEGEIVCVGDDGELRFPKDTIECNLRRFDFDIIANSHHEHHTIGFFVPGRIVETDDEPSSITIPFKIENIGGTNSRYLEIIDEIILAHTIRNRGELACAGLILELLDRISRHARTESSEPYINRSYIKKAKSYIFNHLREPIKQSDIAAHLGISPEYLCAIFKRSEGQTVMSYVNRLKLEQMLTVMKTTHVSLGEASEMYGYGDPNYVSRLYKKSFGCTVSEALRRDSVSRYTE